MRILMLTQFYLPVIGGEERFVRDISVALAARGHQVTIATLAQPGQPEVEVSEGVRIYRLRGTMQRFAALFSESGRRHAPPFPDPEVVAGLRRVVRRERPEVVHAHNWMVHSFLPLKTWSGARLIVTLHDYSLACAKKRLMYETQPCSGPGLAKCLRCASAHYGPAKGVTTVLSNWAMGLAERATVDMFLPESQAVAVGNGLVGSKTPYQVLPVFVADDVGAVRTGHEARLAQLPDGPFLLFVGDLGRDKGVGVLLEAYVGLSDPPPLVLIGRPGADAPATFPPGVLPLGPWPHDAVIEAWRRSTIALIPSVWPEPFGLVVLEAMATGRPVIASRIGGITDLVVDQVTGLLVTPNDPAALRGAIAELLANPALRARMGAAGQQRVGAFQASTIIPRYERVYAQLLHA